MSSKAAERRMWGREKGKRGSLSTAPPCGGAEYFERVLTVSRVCQTHLKACQEWEVLMLKCQYCKNNKWI